jgi:hypothetical protein
MYCITIIAIHAWEKPIFQTPGAGRGGQGEPAQPLRTLARSEKASAGDRLVMAADAPLPETSGRVTHDDIRPE